MEPGGPGFRERFPALTMLEGRRYGRADGQWREWIQGKRTGERSCFYICCSHSPLTCATKEAVLRPPPGCHPSRPSPQCWQLTSAKDPLRKALPLNLVAPLSPKGLRSSPTEDSQGLRRLLRPVPALAPPWPGPVPRWVWVVARSLCLTPPLEPSSGSPPLSLP